MWVWCARAQSTGLRFFVLLLLLLLLFNSLCCLCVYGMDWTNYAVLLLWTRDGVIKYKNFSIVDFYTHLFNFLCCIYSCVVFGWCGGKMRERERTRTLWLKAKGKSKAFALNVSGVALVTNGLVEYTMCTYIHIWICCNHISLVESFFSYFNGWE